MQIDIYVAPTEAREAVLAYGKFLALPHIVRILASAEHGLPCVIKIDTTSKDVHIEEIDP